MGQAHHHEAPVELVSQASGDVVVVGVEVVSIFGVECELHREIGRSLTLRVHIHCDVAGKPYPMGAYSFLPVFARWVGVDARKIRILAPTPNTRSREGKRGFATTGLPQFVGRALCFENGVAKGLCAVFVIADVAVVRESASLALALMVVAIGPVAVGHVWADRFRCLEREAPRRTHIVVGVGWLFFFKCGKTAVVGQGGSPRLA